MRRQVGARRGWGLRRTLEALLAEWAAVLCRHAAELAEAEGAAVGLEALVRVRGRGRGRGRGRAN